MWYSFELSKSFTYKKQQGNIFIPLNLSLETDSFALVLFHRNIMLLGLDLYITTLLHLLKLSHYFLFLRLIFVLFPGWFRETLDILFLVWIQFEGSNLTKSSATTHVQRPGFPSKICRQRTIKTWSTIHKWRSQRSRSEHTISAGSRASRTGFESVEWGVDRG